MRDRLRLSRSSIEISENCADIAQIMLTCFRQAHATMAAFEQGEADLVIATTSIVLSRRSLPLPAEMDDLGCQADDENDEKAGL